MRRTLLPWIAFVAAAGYVPAQEPTLVEVRKIWDQGPHNAFTDLIRFRGKFFCTFREGEGHVGGDGTIRVLSSKNGQSWRSAALLKEDGIDLRDPKFSITPDGRLMIVAGGSVYRGGRKLLGRQPRVSFSQDGSSWSAPQRVLTEGEWLWRVTWRQGKAYGISYHSMLGEDRDWGLKLVVSDDGIHYTDVARLDVPGRPNETTIRFRDDGTMVALVRREGTPEHKPMAWIGVSPPPYTEWTWKETGMQVGGPNFLILPDGAMWAVTRDYTRKPQYTTVLARMDLASLSPVLTLPSGGDTSYGGLVWHQNLLWISYYSGHEGKDSIYLAKVRLPK